MRLPNWVTRLPWDQIRQAADDNKVPWNLLGVIVQVESAGDPFAVRFEPKWSYCYDTKAYADNLNITQMTEEMCQKTSWGLGQIMGTVARELGFNGHLTELVDPALNLEYCAKKLKQIAGKYDTGRDIFAAYNGGGVTLLKSGMYKNQRYVDKCVGYLSDLDPLIK